ncbi:MAG: methyltransferase domain-containing protein [Bacteroidetes bacterium]|nr:MAG: methyltransferase domain-containing protein [Bacteroidota bacterium]
MSTAFDQDQFMSIYPNGIARHYWTIARNDIIYRQLKSAGLHSKKIVEIGCGRGVVVEYLLKKGVNITGVELAATQPYPGAENAVILGQDALTLPEAQRAEFEVMMMLDVAEHIEKPEAFIQMMLQAYPNVKHILLTVPACQELWSNYDVFNGHYRRYDLAALEELVQKFKWKSLGSRYFFHSLYPMMKLIIKMSNSRETTIKAPSGAIQLFIHKVFQITLLLDYLVVPSRWKGSSLIVIANKGNL